MNLLINLWHLFLGFGRAGILGFGGGPSSVPLIKIEVVDNFQWMTSEEFATAVAFGNSLPGPIATKLAGYVGYKVGGVAGAIAGLAGIVLPSLVAMIILFAIYQKNKDLPFVAGMTKAIRPVVAILLLLLIFDIFPTKVINWETALIAVLSFIALYFLKVHPAIVVVAALVVGAVALK